MVTRLCDLKLSSLCKAVASTNVRACGIPEDAPCKPSLAIVLLSLLNHVLKSYMGFATATTSARSLTNREAQTGNEQVPHNSFLIFVRGRGLHSISVIIRFSMLILISSL